MFSLLYTISEVRIKTLMILPNTHLPIQILISKIKLDPETEIYYSELTFFKEKHYTKK